MQVLNIVMIIHKKVEYKTKFSNEYLLLAMIICLLLQVKEMKWCMVELGMTRGGGGGELQPSQNLGNFDFLGRKRNLGKANF